MRVGCTANNSVNRTQTRCAGSRRLPRALEPMPLAWLPNIVIGLVLSATGATYALGAAQRWKWLVDPPVYLFFCYSQSMLKLVFGSEGCRLISIATGAVYAICGIFVCVQPFLVRPCLVARMGSNHSFQRTPVHRLRSYRRCGAGAAKFRR